MNDVTPTVTIKTENGPVRINLSDYDAEKHTLVDEKSTQPAAAKAVDDAFDREDAKKRLKDAGVEFSMRASNEKLKELLAELDAKQGKKEFSVEPKDDKFIVVDADGKQYGDEQYDTEEAAQTMISLLKGE